MYLDRNSWPINDLHLTLLVFCCCQFQEVILVRFSAVNEEEKVGYRDYFKYLSEKKRFGVVGNGASIIKDMYVIPLPRDESLPAALKPYRHKGEHQI